MVATFVTTYKESTLYIEKREKEKKRKRKGEKGR